MQIPIFSELIGFMALPVQRQIAECKISKNTLYKNTFLLIV